ncbi:MAG TPA: YdeI/OmpD-associated family protein [Mycobacterium sp.]|nr:YdeI/OmpD-associated family protein [Mycobacterium sp.]
MKFSTTMFQLGNNTGIEVPADVVAALGAGKRPPVVVNVNGYEYRSTVAPMGGKYLLPCSADRLGGGDAIDVELTPRTVELPDDLRCALNSSATAAAAWEKLSPTGRSMCGPCSTPGRPRRGHGGSPPRSPASKASPSPTTTERRYRI